MVSVNRSRCASQQQFPAILSPRPPADASLLRAVPVAAGHRTAAARGRNSPPPPPALSAVSGPPRAWSSIRRIHGSPPESLLDTRVGRVSLTAGHGGLGQPAGDHLPVGRPFGADSRRPGRAGVRPYWDPVFCGLPCRRRATRHRQAIGPLACGLTRNAPRRDFDATCLPPGRSGPVCRWGGVR